VRAWVGAGVLDAVPGSRPVKVSTGRLAEVVSLVERLRRVGRDRNLLTAVVDRFEDESVASQPRGPSLPDGTARWPAPGAVG